MKLSATAWSFPQLTLKEIIGVLKALGINSVDIGLFYNSALSRDRLLNDGKAYAQELLDLDIDFANLYYLLGDGLAERNLADGKSLKENIEDFKKLMPFLKTAKIPSIMLLPGVLNKGQNRQDALKETVISLKELLPIAKANDVILTIEPHVHSYLESPTLVLELLEQVSVKLTLDYAHFVALGYRQEEIDKLLPHAAHIHLRQARAGALQAKLEQGTINFPAVLASLKEQNYKGYLSIEYVHQDYMNTLYDDVLTETVKMRDLVRRFL